MMVIGRADSDRVRSLGDVSIVTASGQVGHLLVGQQEAK